MADLITQADIKNPALLARPDLGDLITDASDAVVGWTGNNFGVQSYTEVHDGDGLNRLWLRQPPVLSVQSVSIDGNALDNTDGGAWTLNPRTGELVRGNGQDDQRFQGWFPRGNQNVVVAYTAGNAALPPQVRRAVVLTVAHLAQGTDGVTGLETSAQLGDERYEYADPGAMEAIPPMARALLKPFVQDWIV